MASCDAEWQPLLQADRVYAMISLLQECIQAPTIRGTTADNMLDDNSTVWASTEGAESDPTTLVFRLRSAQCLPKRITVSAFQQISFSVFVSRSPDGEYFSQGWPFAI